MSKSVTFSYDVIELLRSVKIIGVRAGTEHRYTGVWVVIVKGRLFVRSWNDKPTGWYRAFRKEPHGSVQLGALDIAVRARITRNAGLQKAVTEALGQKYNTKASRRWVEGFAEATREMTTLELVPL